LSKSRVEENVVDKESNRRTVRDAIDILVAKKVLSESRGARGSRLLTIKTDLEQTEF